jgi:hypothetical protein
MSLALPSAGWAFQNIQTGLQGQAVDIPAAATRAFVCFSAHTLGSCDDSNPAYLDMDSVSAHDFVAQ